MVVIPQLWLGFYFWLKISLFKHISYLWTSRHQTPYVKTITDHTFLFYIEGVTADYVNFKIYPEKSEYIIDATQYFELKCEGKEEIAWSTPKSRGVSLHK